MGGKGEGGDEMKREGKGKRDQPPPQFPISFLAAPLENGSIRSNNRVLTATKVFICCVLLLSFRSIADAYTSR